MKYDTCCTDLELRSYLKNNSSKYFWVKSHSNKIINKDWMLVKEEDGSLIVIRRTEMNPLGFSGNQIMSCYKDGSERNRFETEEIFPCYIQSIGCCNVDE